MPKTSDDYRPCRIIQPDGKTTRGNVLHVNLMHPETAVEKLRGGKIAWVEDSQAEAVLAMWKGDAAHGA